LHQPAPTGNGTALLLRPRDAARALAIGERKLWDLTKRNLIPCVRIGRAVRYSPLDLQAWIDAQKRPDLPNAAAPQT
jgi:excisionase family DNA binding protein